MEQDSLHKIITIEIEYSKLVKSWAEAQKVIDDTRQSIKNLKKRMRTTIKRWPYIKP